MPKITENLRDKKTKIVATLGPASDQPEVLQKLILSGLNVVRCNMSHGDHSEHKARIDNVRAAAAKTLKRVGVLVDLAGPKIRIGDVENGAIEIKPGAKVTLTTDRVVGTPALISVNYEKLPAEVQPGGFIMIEDGKKKLEVLSTNGTTEIVCKVIVGGKLGSKKGLNIPGAYLSLPALTEKDKKDVKFAIAEQADFIALSFVRTPNDIHDLRKILKKAGSEALIIAKIETQESIEQLEDIIMATDGVMVARGDLAVEIGPEKVPAEQERITAIARSWGKPVITATQMLDSMEKSPVPTRAEVSDIATAIAGGTDAIMLSGETSIGQYPVEAVSVMSRVARETEPRKNSMIDDIDLNPGETQTAWLTYHLWNLAEDMGITTVVTLTETGSTARQIARFRSDMKVIAVTPSPIAARQLTLSYGITSYEYNFMGKNYSDVILEVNEFLKKRYSMKKGDKIILSAGFPMGVSGSTNSIVVHTIM